MPPKVAKSKEAPAEKPILGRFSSHLKIGIDLEFMARKIEDMEKSMKRSNDKQLKVEHELCQKLTAGPLYLAMKWSAYPSLQSRKRMTTVQLVLSWKPRALYFPGFAAAEQCDSIIKMAKVHLAPSSLALRKGETAENTKGIRTSSGMFMSASEDKTGTLDLIEEKIARATMIPRTHGEAFNILRYEIGQRYNSHYDAFHPSEYGPQKSQRIASFLLYLSDLEEGGETMFPFENGLNFANYDFQKCVGLKVKPRKGDGLLFYSVFPNGTIDVTSLHGSCPVIKGQKWVATKWLRDQVQDD